VQGGRHRRAARALSYPWLPDLIAGKIHFAVALTPAVLDTLKTARLQGLAT
jgi:hypothetical protein